MLRRAQDVLSKHSERATSPCAKQPAFSATVAALNSPDARSDETKPCVPNAAGVNGEPASEVRQDGQARSEFQQQDTDETLYGLTVLVEQPSEKVDSIDIVAIHGLDGHREATWTDGGSGVNWLAHEACLRNDIPHARVLSFGYNSASYFGRSDANIQDFASGLLAAIKSSRKRNLEEQRPIIFVCHSLGGLVFKQAVARAHEQDRFYARFLSSIKGAVLFATPHGGSDLAHWNLLAARMAKAATIGYTTNTRLAEDLRVVERDSAILGWANELDISSPSNHRNICKFTSPKDQRYRIAIDAICDIIDAPEGNTSSVLKLPFGF
ncbi:hypothetical protein V2A60_006176 [Cordyceps javanica]